MPVEKDGNPNAPNPHHFGGSLWNSHLKFHLDAHILSFSRLNLCFDSHFRLFSCATVI